MHEFQSHGRIGCFVNPTYGDAHLPPFGLLRPKDLRLFVRRVRHARPGDRISYLGCGEFGETYGRPHYHLCLFGFEPSDGVPCGRGSAGDTLYRSAELEELWPHGRIVYGSLTRESARYVAGYSLGKGGAPFAKRLLAHGPEAISDGELSWRPPEVDEDAPRRPGARLPAPRLLVHRTSGDVLSPYPFLRCSLRPAIGVEFYARYADDVRSVDAVRRSDGSAGRVPRLYDRHFRAADPGAYSEVKAERAARAEAALQRELASTSHSVEERLAVKAEVFAAARRSCKRGDSE